MKIIAKNFTNFDNDEALKLATIKRILPQYGIDENDMEGYLFLQEGEREIEENAKYHIFFKNESSLKILTFDIDWTANGGYGRLIEYTTNIFSSKEIVQISAYTKWTNYTTVVVNVVVKTKSESIDITIEKAKASDGDVVVEFFNSFLK